MKENRLTATNIGEILAAALEVQAEDKDNLQHRVRYLAKKHYLEGGRKLDARGTLDFPASEIFRAAILCEFLAFSMDAKTAVRVLQEAERNRTVPGGYPESARTDGGWSFQGTLGAVVKGSLAGEDWLLVVVLRRSGQSSAAGLAGRYTIAGSGQTDVDAIFGREAAASILTINLKKLFPKIVNAV